MKQKVLKGKQRNALYLLSFTPAIAVILGNLAGSWYTLSNIIYTLGILGILEWVTAPEKSNHATKSENWFTNIILFMHVPSQLACIASLFYGIHSEAIQGGWVVAAAISTGINSGSSAMVVAHELIHRKSVNAQLGTKILLFLAGNIYFYVQHIKIHHKWVGTHRDPTTARYGENLYFYFFRSVFQQIVGAYEMEKQRLQHYATPFGDGNYVVRQFLMLLFFLGIVTVLGGLWVLAAFVIHFIMATFVLEYVNYIQHYGLARHGSERVTEQHSWDSNQWISRFVLVDLSRHSDHHYHASKPFHTLEHQEKANQLPSGYAGMFFVAAIPFLWRKLIHPIIDAHELANEAEENETKMELELEY